MYTYMCPGIISNIGLNFWFWIEGDICINYNNKVINLYKLFIRLIQNSIILYLDYRLSNPEKLTISNYFEKFEKKRRMRH